MNEASEILKKVRKIEIKTKELSKHIFSGEYSSTFKGKGMSFSEVRNYQYGDDVRNIDWNVTARTGEPYVKVYEEERELTVMFLVDMSRSSFFGTQNQFKHNINVEICATLAFAALNNNDKVGALLFTDKIEKYIPPKKGKKHILRIIRELIYNVPQNKETDISEAVVHLNNILKKRCIAFILSDFNDVDYADAITIAAKKHDLIGIKVYDDIEKDLPNVGMIKMEDIETGQRRILDTSSAKNREKHREQFNKVNDYLENTFKKTGKSVIMINTKEDYVKKFLMFFKNRHK